MGTLMGSQITSTAVIFDCSNHHSPVSDLSQHHINNNSNAATKVFSISFYNIHKLSSNINSIHHYCQSITHRALFLTKTEIKSLDPKTALFSLLISNGQGMSYFPPSSLMVGHVHLAALMCRPYTSNHTSSLILAFIWLKVSLPRTSKYICTLFRSPT